MAVYAVSAGPVTTSPVRSCLPSERLPACGNLQSLRDARLRYARIDGLIQFFQSFPGGRQVKRFVSDCPFENAFAHRITSPNILDQLGAFVRGHTIYFFFDLSLSLVIALFSCVFVL